MEDEAYLTLEKYLDERATANTEIRCGVTRSDPKFYHPFYLFKFMETSMFLMVRCFSRIDGRNLNRVEIGFYSILGICYKQSRFSRPLTEFHPDR